MIKLPKKIEDFAKRYFAAQDLAVTRVGEGKFFRPVDKKELARECKLLLESGESENLWQLAQDLRAYRPDYQAITHVNRLNAFARHANVVYGPRKIQAEARPQAAAPKIVATIPTQAFSPRASLATAFIQALENGMSVKDLENHAQEVLVFANRQVQKGKIATSLEELIRSSGLSRREVAEIVLEM